MPMAFEMLWYAEPRVILERFSDYVTLDDLNQLIRTYDLWTQHLPVDVPVHRLIDLTKVHMFPTNLSQIRQAVVPAGQVNGWIILIVPPGNALLQFVGAYTARLRTSGDQFRVVHNLEDATVLLKSIDPTLSLPQAS